VAHTHMFIRFESVWANQDVAHANNLNLRSLTHSVGRHFNGPSWQIKVFGYRRMLGVDISSNHFIRMDFDLGSGGSTIQEGDDPS